MKNFFKSILAVLLWLLARAVVRRYRPQIVMVSGSVGKTSTKDAVAAVLATRFFVRKSEKSFNSEFGVPFTILGVANPWANPLAWISLVKSAIALLVLPNHYPNMLVLETGADRPGDLARILRIATPDVVVITKLPDIPVHVEAYASPEAVREEEFSPAYALAPGTPLIIPSDDPYAVSMASRTAAQSISYGTGTDATIRISGIHFDEDEGKVVGMTATVHTPEEEGHLRVKGSVGRIQLLPAAAALAVARAFHIPLSESLIALESYEPPPGRGRLFLGKNGSMVIDDSYNASPAAVAEALGTLKEFPHARRRIAILGDMLELGRYSVVEHEHIGTLANQVADIVAAVGIRTRTFTGLPEGSKVLLFENSFMAALALPELVQEGDVILVKGSQSIRTERIVLSLLADQGEAPRLVRQEKKWKQRR
jgi:UDP-N-acetylmuramyl pentapeptide synthase